MPTYFRTDTGTEVPFSEVRELPGAPGSGVLVHVATASRPSYAITGRGGGSRTGDPPAYAVALAPFGANLASFRTGDTLTQQALVAQVYDAFVVQVPDGGEYDPDAAANPFTPSLALQLASFNRAIGATP